MNFFGTVSARLTHLFSELGCNSSSLQRNQEKQPQKPPAYPPVGTPCCVPSALSTAQRALGPREVTSTLPRRSGARSQRCPPRLRPPLRWARSSPEDPRPARSARPRGDARPKPAGGSPQHPGFFGPPVAAEPLGAGGGHSLGTPGSPSRPPRARPALGLRARRGLPRRARRAARGRPGARGGRPQPRPRRRGGPAGARGSTGSSCHLPPPPSGARHGEARRGFGLLPRQRRGEERRAVTFQEPPDLLREHGPRHLLSPGAGPAAAARVPPGQGPSAAGSGGGDTPRGAAGTGRPREHLPRACPGPPRTRRRWGRRARAARQRSFPLPASRPGRGLHRP